jgi:transketolase
LSKVEAIRYAYGKALADAGKDDERIIVLDADVSNSTRSVEFARAFPGRFINLGIAEANMVCHAAGLAAVGFIPVVNTFSFLLCERALDQIRSSVAFNKLNVKFAANYGGLSDSYDGASHHSISDLAVIRAIPGMTLVNISDAACMRKAMLPIINHAGPVYFRLCRAETPIVNGDGYVFEIGRGNLARAGSDCTIVATGAILYRALEAAERLQKTGIDARVVEIHTLKPLDNGIIIRAAQETGALLTVEEGTVLGGLGSAVAEVIARTGGATLETIGINDCFAQSGPYEALLDRYGLAVEDIVRKAAELAGKRGGRT